MPAINYHASHVAVLWRLARRNSSQPLSSENREKFALRVRDEVGHGWLREQYGLENVATPQKTARRGPGSLLLMRGLTYGAGQIFGLVAVVPPQDVQDHAPVPDS